MSKPLEELKKAEKKVAKKKMLFGDRPWHWIVIVAAGCFGGWLIGHVAFGALLVGGLGVYRRFENIRRGRI